MENEIVIKPSFVFKDYFKVNLLISFNKLYYYILFTIIIIFLGFDIYSITQGTKKLIDLFIFPDLVFLFLPIVIIFSVFKVTKRSFRNPKLKENILYKLNSENYEETGDSYYVKYFWKDIFRITERKDYFLIYLTKHLVKIIFKADLKDNQYNDLKSLFNSLNVKKKLM